MAASSGLPQQKKSEFEHLIWGLEQSLRQAKHGVGKGEIELYGPQAAMRLGQFMVSLPQHDKHYLQQSISASRTKTSISVAKRLAVYMVVAAASFYAGSTGLPALDISVAAMPLVCIAGFYITIKKNSQNALLVRCLQEAEGYFLKNNQR